MNVSILIPAYRPDHLLIELVDQLRSDGFDDLVVVDDGGGHEFAPLFEALQEKATVLVHPQNRGKGAALKTGLAFLTQARPLEVGTVTVDADGQHRPKDIRRVAQELVSHPQALILGVRSFTRAGVPLRSRLGNLFTRLVFWATVGKFVRDTQTGLRGIPQQLMPNSSASSLTVTSTNWRCCWPVANANFAKSPLRRSTSTKTAPPTSIP
ncbi:glycosyltransferase family 2 protein [bacterium]|nr:glycosyltransferase family 2 protein [bacterium]